MFELITQIIILVSIYFLLSRVFFPAIGKDNLRYLGGFALLLLMLLAFLEPTNRTIGILWGILSFPLRPLGLSLLLLGSALRFGVNKLKPAAGSQALAAFLILLITSLPITSYLLTSQAEQQSLLQASQQDAAVRAIVVLGDGALPTDPAYRIRTQLNSVTDGISVSQQARLVYAAQLYNSQVSQRTNAPLIIVSAGASSGNENSDSAITNLLTNNGVTSDRIQIDRTGNDPRSSALVVQQQFGNSAIQTPLMVVSPAINMRRVASTFAKLGFQVIPKPTDFYIFQLQGGWRLAALTDLVPSAEALVISTRVIDEYLTTVYYFLRGWLVDPLGV